VKSRENIYKDRKRHTKANANTTKIPEKLRSRSDYWFFINPRVDFDKGHQLYNNTKYSPVFAVGNSTG